MARAPRAPQDLRYRLVALKEKSKRGVDNAAWASCLPLFFLLWGISHFFGSVIMVPLATMAGPWIGSYFMVESLVSLVLGILGAIGAVICIRLLGRRAFTRWHAQVWSELHTTNLAVMVVDEAYTKLLSERIGETWGLRWIAPPPATTLEQQLDFAASYLVSLRKLLWGVGRLENMPLWQGGVTWFAGTTRGLTCGCLGYMLLSALGMALWVIGILLYLQRCAALAAICDFLLFDDQPPRLAVPKNPGSMLRQTLE